MSVVEAAAQLSCRHHCRCQAVCSPAHWYPPPLVQTINDHPGEWLMSYGIKGPIKLKLIKSAATQVGCMEGACIPGW